MNATVYRAWVSFGDEAGVGETIATALAEANARGIENPRAEDGFLVFERTFKSARALDPRIAAVACEEALVRGVREAGLTMTLDFWLKAEQVEGASREGLQEAC